MSTSDASAIPHGHESAHTHGASCSHAPARTDRTVRRLQVLTICWMLVECSVALTAAWRAHSPALLAFGSDSSVELLSAIVVLLQFTSVFKVSTERAALIAGILLYLLAGIVAVISVSALVLRIEPDTSKLGIGITLIALTIMPILSRAKRKHANEIGNRALAADAVQSATCAYLAGLTLLGLILNATLHIRWVDPLAALIAIPIIVIEARRAMRGEACC
ncbi:cation efflux protein [Granulicella mallensis MP5ACTX8]|uniref:Cation efflux protein n=1 Tax=Granulicella mallensis (strain ATCC BAA-1857 / DSM 23137 / MP5ACTX8) TaxID=682795 RepID=G8NX65_GRAMM|nr:cation efflux protein [Granulicella mallensis MP5ACTX8]